jgi:hypothetical protein
MSKPICFLYLTAVLLMLLLLGTAGAAVTGLLLATRATSAGWFGPGTRGTLLVDHAAAWLTQQAAVHGAGIAAAAAAIAIVSLVLATLVVRRMVQRTPRLVLSRGGLGEVVIDLRQVGLLAQHEAEQVTGVREVDTAATSGKTGLDVQQTIAVEPQFALTPLAEQIQRRVKQSLEFHLGLPVASVQVLLRHTTLSRHPL